MSGSREAAQSQRHQDQDVFRRVTSKQMVGIFVSVWARSALCRHIRHLAISCVRAGILGLLGNKVRTDELWYEGFKFLAIASAISGYSCLRKI